MICTNNFLVDVTNSGPDEDRVKYTVDANHNLVDVTERNPHH